MKTNYFQYLSRLISDQEEQAKFRKNPDKAMEEADVSPDARYAIKSLAFIKLTPKQIAEAVLAVLEEGVMSGGGSGSNHGPP